MSLLDRIAFRPGIVAFWIGAAAVLSAAAPAPSGATLDEPSDVAEFTRLLQAEADADASYDDGDLASRTTDGYFEISEKGSVSSRAELLRSTQNRATRDSAARARFIEEYRSIRLRENVQDVHVARYGGTAIVRSQVAMDLVLQHEPVKKLFAKTHVYVRRGATWLLASQHETVIPLDPVPAKIDPSRYDEYVGDYQLTANRTYTVTRSGSALFIGKVRTRELVPENETSFVVKGDQYRVVFRRNMQGKVDEMRWIEFPGVEYSAFRVE